MTVRKLRKPLPDAYPLAERFLDIDAMIEPGDSDAAVELPGETWTELLEAAQDEQERRERGLLTKAPEETDVRAEYTARYLDLRGGLGDALGWGTLNGDADLLQVVRGYVMAHELETPSARIGAGVALTNGALEELDELRKFKAADEARRKAVTFSKVPPAVTAWVGEGGSVSVRLLLEDGEGCVITPDAAREVARQIAASLQEVECRHCGDGHDSAKCKAKPPAEPRGEGRGRSRPQEAEPTIIETADKQRAEECGRRLNGAGWKRAAKKAREENSPIVCHHCGAGMGDNTGGLTNSYGYRDEVPAGTFCTQCLARLRANPREWDRHETTKPAPKTEGSEGGEGTEVYCRSCKKYYPAGEHTHVAAPKGKKKAQAGLDLT